MLKPKGTYNHHSFMDAYMHILDLVEETTSHVTFKVLWLNRHHNIAVDQPDTVRIDKSDLSNWELMDV